MLYILSISVPTPRIIMAITPKERELAMLEGGKLDRMPIWQINGIVAAKVMGYEWKDVRFDAKVSSKVISEFSRKSGTDILGQGCVEPNSYLMDLPGVEVKLTDDNYANVMTHYFAEPEDIDKKEFFDPTKKKDCPWLWKGLLGKTTDLASKEKDFIIQQVCWSVFTTAGFLRNPETMLMDIATEPELAHKAVKRAAEFVDSIMCAGLSEGCGGAYLADPVASGSLIDEATFRAFNLDHLKRLMKGYKSKFGVASYLHVCGETAPVAKPISETGAALFSFDFMNDPAAIRKLTGDKIILAGNLNPMDVIWQGNPQKVIDASKKFIDAAGKKAVLATGCETPRDTPIENLQAMVTAVEKYAKY